LSGTSKRRAGSSRTFINGGTGFNNRQILTNKILA
jgi:hypothetical protein